MSGEIAQLSAQKMALVERAMRFYGEVAPLIRDGQIRRFGAPVSSYRHPNGWQAVRFEREGEVLLVVHTFARSEDDGEICVALPTGDWQLADEFSDAPREAEMGADWLKITRLPAFSGWVGRLRRNEEAI